MARPTNYDKTTDFTQYAAVNPNNKYNAPDHDREFDNIATSLDETQAWLANITRDDNALKNGVVTPDSLNTATVAMLNKTLTPRGDWAAGVLYAISDYVERPGEVTYVAIVPHTSSDFAVDRAAGKWMVFTSGSQSAADDAALAAAEAQGYATSAAGSAATATNAANTATTQAGLATSAASSAASSFDSFDDRYLGAKASDPLTDNDGNALLDGAMYWNTTLKRTRIYDIALNVWNNSAVYFNPVTQRFNGGSASYTLSIDPGSADALIIAVNGVMQTPGVDFTVSSTTLTPTVAWPSGTNNVVVQNFGVAGVVNVVANNSVTQVKMESSYEASLAKLNVEQTFTAQQTPMRGTLTDGANVDWNGDSHGQSVKLTTAASRTFNAPTNINEDALYVLRLTTGGYTPSWNAAYKWPSGGTPSSLSSGTYVFTFIGGSGNTLIPTGPGYLTGV